MTKPSLAEEQGYIVYWHTSNPTPWDAGVNLFAGTSPDGRRLWTHNYDLARPVSMARFTALALCLEADYVGRFIQPIKFTLRPVPAWYQATSRE